MDTRDLSHPTHRRLKATHGPGRCSACWNRGRCVPADLRGLALTAFEHAIGPMIAVSAGQALVTEGDPADGLYVLERGALKSLHGDTSDAQDLTAFHFPGAVLGLAEQQKAVWTGTYVALEESRLCRIPFEALNSALHMRLSGLASEALRGLYDFHVNLVHKSSSQRLAALLLQIAQARHTLSFHLPMTHADLANYLFIKEDSIGEGFRTLVACGWIRYQRREVHVRDRHGLLRYVNG